MSSPLNLVTIDLDTPAVRPDDVEVVTNAVLDGLARSNTTATFFMPRALAEGNVALGRRIVGAGHEIACLTTNEPAKLTPYAASFIDEIMQGRAAIEDATGIRVRGHRNARLAVDHHSEWTYDVLVDHGFEYDSSRFPARYTEFGSVPVPRTIHAVRRWGGTLLEIPLSTADLLKMRLRLGTTGDLRTLPLAAWNALVSSRQLRDEPLMLHLRASELRASSAFARRSRMTADRKTVDRMAGLVGRFPFTSVKAALPDLLRSAPIMES
jgi:hypothetical protein